MDIHVYRYNPEIDAKPYLKKYQVDIKKVKGSMLLHALEHIKEQDDSLTFRRSCASGRDQKSVQPGHSPGWEGGLIHESYSIYQR